MRGYVVNFALTSSPNNSCKNEFKLIGVRRLPKNTPILR